MGARFVHMLLLHTQDPARPLQAYGTRSARDPLQYPSPLHWTLSLFQCLYLQNKGHNIQINKDSELTNIARGRLARIHWSTLQSKEICTVLETSKSLIASHRYAQERWQCD